MYVVVDGSCSKEKLTNPYVFRSVLFPYKLKLIVSSYCKRSSGTSWKRDVLYDVYCPKYFRTAIIIITVVVVVIVVIVVIVVVPLDCFRPSRIWRIAATRPESK